MRIYCPLDKPVSVRDYIRFRLGKWEHVRSHCRHWPRTRTRIRTVWNWIKR